MLTINSALLSLKNICWDEHNCLVSWNRPRPKQESAFWISRSCVSCKKKRCFFNPSENKALALTVKAEIHWAVKYRLSNGQNYPKELSDRRIISDEVSDRRFKKDELSDGANYPKITTDQVVGLGAVSATCCSLIIAETALKRILAEGNLQRQNKNIFIPFPHYIADVLNV